MCGRIKAYQYGHIDAFEAYYHGHVMVSMLQQSVLLMAILERTSGHLQLVQKRQDTVHMRLVLVTQV